MLVNHLMYNSPEHLQRLLDDCCLYRYVIKRSESITKLSKIKQKSFARLIRKWSLPSNSEICINTKHWSVTTGAEQKKCSDQRFTEHNKTAAHFGRLYLYSKIVYKAVLLSFDQTLIICSSKSR